MKQIIAIALLLMCSSFSYAQRNNNNVHPNNKRNQTTVSRQRITAIPTKRNAENGHEWIDLGLSVKWATCNVGANKPEDYGGYYAWGEASTKSYYNYDNYFDSSYNIYKNGTQTQISPTSGHDTARENWGGTWRMPTKAEYDELCKKCKWMWISKNRHKGYRVTGPNGNCIFLPAADHRVGTDFSGEGTSGLYWSSTLGSTSSNYAYYLSFFDGHYETGIIHRSCGQSIRPVCP